IDIEIFGLDRPVAAERLLDAAADGPAGPRGAAGEARADAGREGAAHRADDRQRRDAGIAELRLAVGETAGGVEQPVIGGGPADAAAECAEPRERPVVRARPREPRG